jgi:hypothetical protein
MSPSPLRVILYMRPGCHLCEEAEELLLALGRQRPLALARVNILEDPQLYERYKWTIPVIEIEQGPTLHAPIDEQALRKVLVPSSYSL